MCYDLLSKYWLRFCIGVGVLVYAVLIPATLESEARHNRALQE